MIFSLISKEEMRYYTDIINILIGIRNRGGGTKSKVMRQANVSYSGDGDILVEELVGIGFLKYLDLKGDRGYYSITSEGRRAITAWYNFIKTFNETKGEPE